MWKKYIYFYDIINKYVLNNKKMHGTSASRALLPNLRMHASLSCVALNKYYEDSVQVFGAFTGLLRSLITSLLLQNPLCVNRKLV
jgi:hypothetical protein